MHYAIILCCAPFIKRVQRTGLVMRLEFLILFPFTLNFLS
jgi:hypothetical protein